MMPDKPDLFQKFFHSEKASGFVLIFCTLISLILANTSLGDTFINSWQRHLDLSFLGIELNLSIEHWINDGLMAIFFLLVGLEIERELYIGELSTFKNALLPILAAIGGMIFPALIHYLFTNGTPEQNGFGIPMATDIAFSLGILSLLGNKIPLSVKIFLTALAIIDDLGAITVIAIFYTKGFALYYFITAVAIFALLFLTGKYKVQSLPLYIIGGIIMWYCMLKSGVHASIAGVILAFAIPFHNTDHKNISFKLQRSLHYPVAFFILPLFALTNTAITLPEDIVGGVTNSNSLGIMTGLLAGKFIGIVLISYLAVKFKLASLAEDLNWTHICAVGLLGGIGFTMSIFITNLAFADVSVVINSKISILIASTIAAISGYLMLRYTRSKN